MGIRLREIMERLALVGVLDSLYFKAAIAHK
jgi:hypothetical protein